MRPLRLWGLWLVPAFMWLAWLTYASLAPVPQGLSPLPDKWLHFSAYAIQLFLFGCCFRIRFLPLLIMAGAAGGMGLEFLQGMTGYRGFEWADGLANLAGAVCGAILAATPLGDLYQKIETLSHG